MGQLIGCMQWCIVSSHSAVRHRTGQTCKMDRVQEELENFRRDMEEARQIVIFLIFAVMCQSWTVLCVYYKNMKINVHVLMCIDITTSSLFSHFHSDLSELDGFVCIL